MRQAEDNINIPCSSCQTLNRVKVTTEKQAVCAKCKLALSFHDGIVELNDDGFFKLIRTATLPVVVDFWAEWCGPCKAFAPVFAQAAKDQAGTFIFAKLNTEQFQKAAQAHSIRGIPAILAFQGGALIKQQAGAFNLPQFKQWLATLP